MKLSFRNRILFTISAACLICTVTAIWISTSKLEENGRASLVEKSRAILSRLEVGAQYVAEMETLDGVIADTIKKYPNGHLSEEQRLKVLKSVPIFAAFKIGAVNAEKENYQFRVASDHPRNKNNAATPEEMEMIKRFQNNPNIPEISEMSPDGKLIRVSRPVRILTSRGCLICHGDPSTSPWKNGKDILGYEMENMKDGEIRGTFTIVSSLEPVRASVKASAFNLIFFGAGIMLAALFLGFAVIRKPIHGINHIANDLSKTADEVAGMSSEITLSSERLSESSSQQASALQETSASMEEVRSMVAMNSENARKSSVVSDESQTAAQKGKTVVQEMIQSISEIDQSNQEIVAHVDDSNRRINEIVKVISDIDQKTKVINEIVFQTKLLSFNASVEAARAGEHGKGFSVVAEEIGSLAQMSGNAAAEITEMLAISTKKVESIVQETQSKVETLLKTSQNKLESGTKNAHRCGEVLDEIVNRATEVSQMVESISSSSQEQTKGVNEISKAITQLDQITQQNASASQTSAATAGRLSEQVSILRIAVLSLIETLSGEKENRS